MATDEEKIAALEPVEIKDDMTIAELRPLWEKAYQTVGHKVLGRMLLGKTKQEALRLNGSG